MRELVTEIEIEARPSQVWDILMDFDAYPSWNPFVRRISGKATVGSRIEVVMEPPGGKPMRFRPKVLTVRPDREFRWKGRLFVPGLFDGEHIFVIAPRGRNSAHLIQRERFGGILVPFVWKMLDTKTRKGFAAMNKALKSRAEKVRR